PVAGTVSAAIVAVPAIVVALADATAWEVIVVAPGIGALMRTACRATARPVAGTAEIGATPFLTSIPVVVTQAAATAVLAGPAARVAAPASGAAVAAAGPPGPAVVVAAVHSVAVAAVAQVAAVVAAVVADGAKENRK
ncbi:MAG: hypothetical protein ACOYB3_17440, partial [Azonexus sp.]